MTTDHETGNPKINGEPVRRAGYIGRQGGFVPGTAVERLQSQSVAVLLFESSGLEARSSCEMRALFTERQASVNPNPFKFSK